MNEILNDEKKQKVCIEMPKRMKDAAEAEARRRGISLSALIKLQLSNFLPENIDASILINRTAN